MAYSNWGENISNTFMNMYATNAQKKLEQERLAMERQKLESQLETDKMSREWTGEQMARAREKEEFYNNNMVPITLGDTNKNGDYSDDFTMMRPDWAAEYDPYAYREVSVPTFEDNQYGTTKQWTQGRDVESLLGLHSTIASGRGQSYENELNRQNDTENARIQANASSVQSSLMQQKMAWDNMTTLGTNIQSDLDTIKHYMFVDGNGQLKAYGATAAAANEYIGRMMRAHPGMSEQQVKDQISNALLQGAMGGRTKRNDAEPRYILDPKTNKLVRVEG